MKVRNDECLVLISDLRSCLRFDNYLKALDDTKFVEGREALRIVEQIFKDLPSIVQSEDHVDRDESK